MANSVTSRAIWRSDRSASGVLANPHTPKIAGAESFQGPMFHSGHWDHAVAYAGKRVGVIGSGCSAAQIVPILRPLIPPQGHLAAYTPTNVLIISDSAARVLNS